MNPCPPDARQNLFVRQVWIRRKLLFSLGSLMNISQIGIAMLRHKCGIVVANLLGIQAVVVAGLRYSPQVAIAVNAIQAVVLVTALGNFHAVIHPWLGAGGFVVVT